MELINHILSERLGHALGWTLIHSLWQASLIALIMSIYLKRYAKEASVIRYRIALLALVMVLASSIVTCFYIYSSSADIPEVLVVSTGVAPSVFVVDAWNSSGTLFLGTAGRFLEDHFQIILLAWFVGICLFSLRVIGGYAYTKALRKPNDFVVPIQILQIFNDLKKKLNLKRSVELLGSSKIDTPIMAGFLKPVVILPIGIINQLELNQVEAILAHELAHIVRNDFLINLIQTFIETVFYYHPAVWWISANIRSERENCCDEFAVTLCGNPIAYAKTLIKIQEIKINHIPSLAIPFAHNKSVFFDRINRIMNQPQNRSQIREKFAATVLLFSAVFCFASENNSTAPDEIEATEYTTISIDDASISPDVLFVVQPDTIPKKKKKRVTIESESDDKTVEIHLEDGEITDMKVNGESVEPEQYNEYKDLYGIYEGAEKGHWFNNNINGFDDFYFNLDSVFKPDMWNHFEHLDSLKDFNFKWGTYDSLLKKNYNHNWVYDSEKMKESYKDYMDAFEFNFKELDSINIGNQMEMAFKYYDEALKNLDSTKSLHKFWADSTFYMLPQKDFYFNMDSLLNNSFKGLKLDSSQFMWNFDFKELEGLNERIGDSFLYYNDGNTLFYGNKVSDVIIRELWKDDLIEEGEDNHIELSGKGLKVNGKTQTKETWKKYKKIYEDRAGHELTEGSKLEYKVSKEKKKPGKRNKRI